MDLEKLVVPDAVVALAHRYGQQEWLARLPALVERFARQWSLDLEPAFTGLAGASWVAPAGVVDGVAAVLKVGMPSRESRTEAEGLRFFAGRGAVRLLRADDDEFVLVEERCLPGHDLSALDADAGNAVAAEVLRELWLPAPPPGRIESLADLAEEWIGGFARIEGYPHRVVDVAVAQAGELAASQPELVVVHGDFNPGNVLRAERGWLAIDPKPLVGEPAYDLAQLLANRLGVFEASLSEAQLSRQVDSLVEALGLDRRRVLGWAVVKSLAWTWGAATAGVFASLLGVAAD
ncbi:MAG TPA: aminoglycoside phosphotransferase family protein [Acidimicrobiales bacterium]|nr:aminoglycoside phosphotransferase family protein [Acidimicrobiales bacterium]